MDILAKLRPDVQQSASVKTMIPVGAGLDIPTGFFVTGRHGQKTLVGGLGSVNAIVGRGNMYKSTVKYYMMLSALARICATTDSYYETYDTESNIYEEPLKRFTRMFPQFATRDIIAEGIWKITDKQQMYANKWHEQHKRFLESKLANKKDLMVTTPFLDRDNKTPLKIILPTFSCVDSFSEFETENSARIQDENELGDSGANTIFMRQGIDKTRFLSEVPTIYGKANDLLMLTAHLDGAVQVASGPYAPPPPKQLQHMQQGDKIKNVTGKFLFLMNTCWWAKSATPLLTKDKTPQYPANEHDDVEGDKDLNVVTLHQLRCKSGPSGYSLDIVVSQRDGVQPTLTEFLMIKDADRFGIEGNQQHYSMTLYPDVKLQRTTLRQKINSDPKLCRAINITSELYQMTIFQRAYARYFCTPKELYDGIIAQGYDWDMILGETRGWFTVNDDDYPLKELSILDLLRMRVGEYKPYWLK